MSKEAKYNNFSEVIAAKERGEIDETAHFRIDNDAISFERVITDEESEAEDRDEIVIEREDYVYWSGFGRLEPLFVEILEALGFKAERV